jgi:uncharacterized protein with HEPN domain
MNELDSRVSELLKDIHISAKRIRNSLQKKTLESFISEAGMDIQDLVAYRLIIIGEASSALLKKYPQFCEQHPEIPLRQARGMRNTLIHEYHDVNWLVVWNTVQEQLPLLIDAVEPFLSKKS